MDERVWLLPGPRSFVRDIVAEYGRGRHVTVVLPEVLASDAVFTDGLGIALLDEFARQSVSARRIYDAGEDASILDTVSQALIFDDPPATVSALLRHPEVENTVAVVVARELGTCARDGLPAFLERVELESHATMNYAQRLSFVAILARGELPGFRGGASSDVAMTSIWWWARIARWDVAAHIADLAVGVPLQGVLADVRTESIVEVARWELDLAEHLVTTWEGEPRDLPSLLKDSRSVSAPAIIGSRYDDTDGLRPPDPVLVFWDQRVVEGWHDQLSVTTCSLAAEPERLSRLVWAAQARVLLPWIEERRSTLQAQVAELLGPQRLASMLCEWFDPPVEAQGLVEIGVLDVVIRRAFGSRNTELRDASRRLREARNRLAHMCPLSLGEQQTVLAACQVILLTDAPRGGRAPAVVGRRHAAASPSGPTARRPVRLPYERAVGCQPRTGRALRGDPPRRRGRRHRPAGGASAAPCGGAARLTGSPGRGGD
jgi:hypothetical protein